MKGDRQQNKGDAWDSDAVTVAPSSRWQQCVAWMEKYKLQMMACHFSFLAVTSALVAGMAGQVAIQNKHENGVYFTQNSILATFIYLVFSTAIWVYSAIICMFQAVDEGNQSFWDYVGVNQKRRFWFWFLGVNGTSFAMWVVITTLFWDVTWVCWIGKGEGAEINPYSGGVCNQLTNIWFYAIFNVIAVFINFWLVVEDQLVLVERAGVERKAESVSEAIDKKHGVAYA
ncbi:hypothetical protein CcCBS67573_g05217 [Chytriomyces confervae]|uniref:Uncharacterized protein n=1 Tax=Chytriomyces confervae TaxID=246404 RepID=A0A507FAZ7_9FUNG|nr:hypothetical protein HDU80_006702 [Chytriomyces hyalinus]TPX73511.1 hypothetical protein CcCBS67573_g05217 [Chytriomyces confervae]